MKVTLLGSLGNINRFTIPRLIDHHHEVTVVTSNATHKADIEKLGARALIGSMQDVIFLTQALMGADIAYLMISGSASDDLMASVKNQADIFATAVKNSGVKNVVNLSSIGAQNPEAGILYMYHYVEEALSAIKNINLAIIRPVGFYSNLYGDLQTIKTQRKIFSSVPVDVKRAWTDPSDIAAQQYAFLTNIPSGKTIKYVVSDYVTGNDWVRALSEHHLFVDYVTITDEQVKQNLLSAGFSEINAEAFAQMIAAQRTPDAFYEDIEAIGFYQGKVKLIDFAKSFAAIVNTK